MCSGVRKDLKEARRQAMMDAAEALFLEKGYGRTSLSDIIRRSKGSRTTLYENFGSKEGLLRTIIKEACLKAQQAIQADDKPLSLTEESLVDLGVRFAAFALTPMSLAVFRIIAMERKLIPELAENFFETSILPIREQLIRRFQNSLDAEKLPCSIDRVATVFLGSILGDLHFRHSLGLSKDTPEEIREHVRSAVRIFLNGIGGVERKAA
ncbi:MAG: TetR/AcrR family transcriptional regulator [Alphaproteobacteria bacterium]|nr:TetR/AcrR family transcriptional regulator [Alphaproteobacteria bacterium]